MADSKEERAQKLLSLLLLKSYSYRIDDWYKKFEPEFYRSFEKAIKRLPKEIRDYVDKEDIEFQFFTRYEKNKKMEASGKASRIANTITLKVYKKSDIDRLARTIIHEAFHLAYDDVSEDLKRSVSKKAMIDGEKLLNFAGELLPPDHQLKSAQNSIRELLTSIDDVHEGRKEVESLHRYIYSIARKYKNSLSDIANEIGIDKQLNMNEEDKKYFGSYLLVSLSDFYAIEALGRDSAFHSNPFEESYARRVVYDNDLRMRTFKGL